MPRLRILLLSGLVWASLAATAQSQEGSSLYEPFSQPNPAARAERFVDELQLDAEVSRAQLEDGVLVDRRTGELRRVTSPPGAASARAAGGDDLDPSFGWLVGGCVLALACSAAAGLPRIASRVT